MFENENTINSAKSISELTKKGNDLQSMLNGLRSTSGWERLKTGVQIAAMINGGGS